MKASYLFFISLFFSFYAQAHQDTVWFSNSEFLVGEVISLKQRVLKVSTSYSDNDFEIEWQDVRLIECHTKVTVFTDSGNMYNGFLELGTDTGFTYVYMGSASDTVRLNLNNIVGINQIEDNFLDRFSAAISMGFSYTKNNNLRQLTSMGSFGYNTPDWSLSSSFSGVRSNQDGVDPTRRTDADLSGNRIITADWFAGASINWLQNDEQLLDLRTIGTIGVGNYLWRTNQFYVSASGGISFNNEQFTVDSLEASQSLEGAFALEANFFSYENISFFVSGTGYPSITEQGRFRSDIKSQIKYDLPLDFFISANFTFNLDSQPIEGAEETDYFFGTTFGWSP